MNRFLIPALAGLMALGTAAEAKTTLTVGESVEPPGLDPTAAAASAIRRVTLSNLFEGLVRITEEGEIVPGLAESWTLSDDGLTYTFKLREGVKFHDGAAFDCSVAKFSYERATAPDSTNAQKGLFAPIESVTCPDPQTAVVKLKSVTSNFLFGMAWGDAVMVHPDSAANNKTNPIGTGPFKFKNWVKGDHVELEKFDGYWGTPAHLDSVKIKFITDASAAGAALLAGDVDVFAEFLAPEMISRFKADENLHVEIGTTAGKVVMSLNNARAPFDDVRVRRAITHAIDRNVFIEAVNSGNGTPVGSHYTPVDPGYIDLTGMYPYDVEKAKALLAEAGVAPGTSFTMSLPPQPYARRGGEVIAAMLAEVGLNVNLVPIEFAQWLEQVFGNGDYDASIIGHTEARDLDVYARDKFYFNYQNPEYKELYKAYTQATDEAVKLDLVAKLQTKIAEDAASVPLYALPKIGVWNAKVEGLWKNLPLPINDLTQARWKE